MFGNFFLRLTFYISLITFKQQIKKQKLLFFIKKFITSFYLISHQSLFFTIKKKKITSTIFTKKTTKNTNYFCLNLQRIKTLF